MKFLYKIHSGYDGFTPSRIPERLLDGRTLRLGWMKYLETIEVGSEVLIYFHGPHRFPNGVYVEGFVREIDYLRNSVLLRVRQFSQLRPLTDAVMTAKIAALVATRYRQVFIYPEAAWDEPPDCNVSSSAQSCADRHCARCSVWRDQMPQLDRAIFAPPVGVQSLAGFRAAYWVIPSRCYLYYQGGYAIARPVRRTSELFYRFKLGEERLAYPLARAMYEALRQADWLDFDAVVPVPLSPDKVASKEIHRTLLLARELSALLGAPLRDVLRLTNPISKRRLLAEGYGGRDFDARYRAALTGTDSLAGAETILLVDDVCTRGTTLRTIARAIRESLAASIYGVTAGQMILKSVVLDDRSLIG